LQSYQPNFVYRVSSQVLSTNFSAKLFYRAFNQALSTELPIKLCLQSFLSSFVYRASYQALSTELPIKLCLQSFLSSFVYRGKPPVFPKKIQSDTFSHPCFNSASFPQPFSNSQRRQHVYYTSQQLCYYSPCELLPLLLISHYVQSLILFPLCQSSSLKFYC
jgi:hypothetical protein